MMKKITLICFFCIANFLTVSLCIAATTDIKSDNLAIAAVSWQKNADTDLIDIAKTMLSKKINKEAITQVFYHQDIEVTKKTVKRRIKSILFLPDTQSVNDYGTEVIYFNNNNERIKLHTVASLSNAGVLGHLLPNNLKVLDSDSYNTFTDSKKIILPVPGLEPSSLLLIDYEVTLDRSLVEMGLTEFISLKYTYNRENFSVAAKWLDDSHISWNLAGGDVTCKQESDSQLYCSAKQIPALVDDSSVYWSDELNYLVIAQKTTWKDAVNYSLDEFSKANEGQEAVSDLIQRLTNTDEELETKIDKLYQFVSRNIRYTSFSEYGHTITPHTFADVIKNKYGDCKDKSALLVEILKQLGVEAYPVLVATKRKRVSKLPLPSLAYFNHMVVCFSHKGTNYCLDPTDYYTQWKTTSNWIQGKVALKLVKGNDNPTLISHAPFTWRLRTNTTLSFTEQGGQTETTYKEYLGEYASSMRSFLSEKRDLERQEWLVDNYHKKVANSVDPEFKIFNLDEMSNKLVVESQSQFKPFVELDEDLIYTEYDAWLRDELANSTIDNKHYGYWFTGLNINSKLVISIGDNWSLSTLGAELKLAHSFGKMDRYVNEVNEHKVEYITNLKIPYQYVEAKDIKQFNRFIKNLRSEAVMEFSAKLNEN